MRILILNWRDVSHPKAGGAETVTMEHAKRWVHEGNDVTWFTSWYSGAKYEEIIDSVRIIRKAGSQTVYLVAPWYLITHPLDYDVIVDEIHGIPFFSPLFTRVPVVVLIHEVAGDIWDYMYRFPFNIIGKTLEKIYFFLYRKNIFWTDAQSTIDELVQKGISRKNCVAIPCPVSIPESVRQNKKELERLPKEKNPTYIFVSRVVRMKGIEEVIKAFSFIVKDDPRSVLWIVGGGEGEYIAALNAMISEYGITAHVKFWGKVNEITKFQLLRKAHLLLHASVKEGWGLVVLEAAYEGTPSVVYDVPGLRDIVNDGKTGVVVRSNSPRDMAKAALFLLKDKKQYALIQRNSYDWVESLKWETVAKESLELLKKASKK